MVNNLRVEPITSSVLQRDKEKVRNFQKKIYQKAKHDKYFKFYSLYDKVYKMENLIESYYKVKKNNGSPGIDEMTFKIIERNGVCKFLEEIRGELRNNKYVPTPVKRVYIEKENGKVRPLGIPTIKDRVIQMSVKLVIEPIYEARFEKNSYGFRPKRSAEGAIKEIRTKIYQEHKNNIFDADIKGYFDNIHHDKLMKVLRRDISDGKLLKLLKNWLKAPIYEAGKLSKSNRGTPQGGVISPLLANIYMDILLKEVNRENGVFKENKVEIISYADDFVLIGKKIPKVVIEELELLLEKMELELNQEKSMQVNVFDTELKFLGFSIRYEKNRNKNKKYYLKIKPSKGSMKRIRLKIKEVIRENKNISKVELSDKLNAKLRGWINYYKIKGISYLKDAKQAINYYMYCKLYKLHKKQKSQRSGRICRLGVLSQYIKKYGLLDIKYL